MALLVSICIIGAALAAFSTPLPFRNLRLAAPPPTVRLDEPTQQAWKHFYVAVDGNDTGMGTFDQSFATLDRARIAVRALPRPWSGDVIVWLHAGTYSLRSTVLFDQSDSGQNGYRVYYQPVGYATDKVEDVALTGGQHVTGWSDPDGDGIYEATAPSFSFRQLYVDGERAIRARAPNVSPNYREADYFKIAGWDAPGFLSFDPGNRRVGLFTADVLTALRQIPAPSLNNVEIVIQAKWDQVRYRIASLQASGAITYAVPMEPERSDYSRGSPKINGQWYHFENALSLLDAESEWFLDTSVQPGKLYYKPAAGQDMTRAVVVAPRIETLFKLQGAPDAPVRNITIRGLTFEHTGWDAPSMRGYTGAQAGLQWHGGRIAPVAPAAVSLEGAHGVVFENNTLRHLGACGIVLRSGTRDTLVRGNRLVDISMTGISVDWLLDPRPADRRLLSTNDVIANNAIVRFGQDYYGGVGIFAGYTDSLHVEHNEIEDGPYTGISLGMGWTSNPTNLRSNVIRHNRIRRVMRLMEDGAGIYILSNQSSTDRPDNGLIIEQNSIEHVIRVPGKSTGPVAGIYLDEGAKWISVRDNQIAEVDQAVHLNTKEGDVSFAGNTGADGRVVQGMRAAPVREPRPGIAHDDATTEHPDDDSGRARCESDKNLLRNPSFELDVDGDGYPDAWSEYKSTNNVRDTRVASNAEASLKATGPVDVYAAQSVTLKPNTRYTLSGYFRTADVEGAGVWMRYAQLEPTTVAYNDLLGRAIRGTEDWTRISVTFTTSASDAAGRLDLFFQLTSGTAWIDDVALCES